MMASSPGLSNKPGVQTIIDDIKGCVDELRVEFNETNKPINDDSKEFQRFCIKLEFLLQHEQVEKSSFLGAKKDYWNYFLDGLSSVKGVNDGLKYVKSLSELKTNLGRGRAFLRFCLMYQRLADSLQLCTTNTKLTSQWYKPRSVWRNPTQCSYVISILYDLNGLTFDLGAQGYDLDNGWPTFARNDLSHGQKWNINFSRSSSISSLNQSSIMPGSPWMSSSFADREIDETDEPGEDRFGTCLSEAEHPLPEEKHEEEMRAISDQLDHVLTEKTNLEVQVAQLQSQLRDSSLQVATSQTRIGELEKNNSELIDNIKQMVQDQTASATSQFDYMAKIQELMGRNSELEKDLLTRDKELYKANSEKTTLEGELSSLTSLLKQTEEKTNIISSDKSNVEDHLATVANSLMEKSALLESMTSQHKSETEELNKKLKQVSDESAKVKSSYTELQQQHNKLREDNSRLSEELSDSNTNVQGLRAKLSSLQATHDSLVNASQQSKDSAVTEMTLLVTKQHELDSKNKELSEDLVRAKDELAHLKETNIQLTTQNEELTSNMASLNEEYTQAVDNFTMNEVKIKEVNEMYEQVKVERDELESNRDKLELDINELKSELLQLYDTLSKEKTESDNSVQTLENQVSALKLTLTDRENKEKEMSEKISELEGELSDMRKIYNDEKASAEKLREDNQSVNKEKTDLETHVDEYKTTVTDLQTKLDHRITEVSELEQQLMNIHAAHETLQKTNSQLESDYETLSQEHESLLAEYDKVRSDVDDQEKKYREIEQRYNELREKQIEEISVQQSEASQVVSENERLVHKNKELVEEIDKLKSAVNLANQDKDNFMSKLKSVEGERDKFASSLVEVNGEIETLRSSLKSLKATELEKTSELNQLQKSLESTKLELTNKQSVMEQQIGALRFQLSSQQMEADIAMQSYRDQQEELQKMLQTINVQERTIAGIEIQLDSLQEERSVETEAHSKQMDEMIKILDEKEADLITLTDDLEALRREMQQMADTNESLSESLVNVKLGSRENQAKNENELIQLREDNVMLKKRLVKLIKDKESLWQTTDELIFKQKRLNTVKWMDDTHILNCMGCRAQFSLMLRKHHCRLCGRVFCWQCSNNWVDTVASCKKARACNQCYIEHSQEMPSTVNSSLLTCETSDADTDSLSAMSPHAKDYVNAAGVSSWSAKAVDSNKGDQASPLPQADSESSISKLGVNHTSTPTDIPFNGYNSNNSAHITKEEEISESRDNVSPLPGSFPSASSPHPTSHALEHEFEEITDEEIERSLGESYTSISKSADTLRDRMASQLRLELKAKYDDVLLDTVPSDQTSKTVSLDKGEGHTICLRVSSPDANLVWKFSSSPKVPARSCFDQDFGTYALNCIQLLSVNIILSDYVI